MDTGRDTISAMSRGDGEGSGESAFVTLSPCHPVTLSSWRGWCYLVWLSFKRQAKARQMVLIALGLMLCSVAIVALITRYGNWGMHHRRHPFRAGFNYVQWVELTQVMTDGVPHAPGATGMQTAILGACRVILSPTAVDEQNRPLRITEFSVFSQWVVFLIFLSFLLPLWSLSFSTEAIGGDRENQSLIWLLSRPIPRPAIYLAKWVSLLPWSIGLNVGGFALLCLAGGVPGRRALVLYWPAVVWATLAFSALFLLFGAYFRRPAVVAIIYSFCLEVVLGNMPGYLKRVSIGFYTRCLMFERAEEYGIQADKPSVFLPVEGWVAMTVLAGGALLLILLGMWVFSRSQYHELD
jgi:ABC-2 type transport system permease protein